MMSPIPLLFQLGCKKIITFISTRFFLLLSYCLKLYYLISFYENLYATICKCSSHSFKQKTRHYKHIYFFKVKNTSELFLLMQQ